MKILFISEKFPYPLDTGGNIRTFNLLRGLSKEHEVTLLATTHGEVQRTHIEEVNKLCKIKLVNVGATNWLHDIIKFGKSIISRTPFVLSRHFYQAVRKEIVFAFKENTVNGIRSHQSSLAFDVVHFNHLDATIYADAVPQKIIKVLDEHNIVVNQINTIIETEHKIVRKLLLKYEYWKLKKYEEQICNQMNLCLVCSEKDKSALRQLGVTRKITVIPNGVDLNYFSVSSFASSNGHDLIFVGTLDYDPCEKGVWYFCDKILPLIKHQIPDVRFVAIGRNPSKRLQVIATANSGITLTGRVEDIRPFIYRARVFVVPLLSGSGTRLKILEAMAMGIPVVTTSIGVEGIEAVSGEHLWIADSPTEFTKAIVRLLCNLNEAEEIRIKARLLVESQYSWLTICHKLLQEYKL